MVLKLSLIHISIAVGNGSAATANYAVAVGSGSAVSGLNGTAVGKNSQATGQSAAASVSYTHLDVYKRQLVVPWL